MHMPWIPLPDDLEEYAPIREHFTRSPQELSALAVTLTRAMLRMPLLETVEIVWRVETAPVVVRAVEVGEGGVEGEDRLIVREPEERRAVVYERGGWWEEDAGEDGMPVGQEDLVRVFLGRDDARFGEEGFRKAIDAEVERNLVEVGRRVRGLEEWEGMYPWL